MKNLTLTGVIAHFYKKEKLLFIDENDIVDSNSFKITINSYRIQAIIFITNST